jgi:small subunit ribosomal protein S17
MPRRILEGKVVSNKCAKTVTVLVERKVRDPLYGKIIRRSAKYAAHDESGEWKIGDKVSIEECRPISKSKKWRVVGGQALGLSQAKTVDDTVEKRASVKKSVEADAAKAKAPAKDDKDK